MKHFIQIRNEIFQLEEVSSAIIRRTPKEDAERFNLAEFQVDVRMASGEVLIFVNEDAEQVWGVLQANAINITPRGNK